MFFNVTVMKVKCCFDPIVLPNINYTFLLLVNWNYSVWMAQWGWL